MRKVIEMGVKEGYNKWAKTYDVDENPLIFLEEKTMLNLIGKVKGKKF